MTITLLLVGKTTDNAVHKLINQYVKRLEHYCKFRIEVIPEFKKRKNMAEAVQKMKEGEAILKLIQTSDEVVLLDENGKERTSEDFAKWLQKQLNSGKKQLIFVVGGPFGFSENVYQRANQKIALSKMTFSHQMVRPFFTEQLYRAFTILKNEPYHHK